MNSSIFMAPVANPAEKQQQKNSDKYTILAAILAFCYIQICNDS